MSLPFSGCAENIGMKGGWPVVPEGKIFVLASFVAGSGEVSMAAWTLSTCAL